MARLVAELLAVAGAALIVLAGVGVLRFPDLYARMHAATKATTLGIALIGLSTAIVVESGRSRIAVAVAFIFVTGPTAAHLLARAAYRAENVTVDLATRDDLALLVDGVTDRAEPARPAKTPVEHEPHDG